MCSVTQSCSTLCDPMDSSLPGSSVHGIFQATILEQVVIFLLQQIFPTQGSNLQHLHLLHWQADSLPLSHKGSPHTILDLSQRPRSESNISCVQKPIMQDCSFLYHYLSLLHICYVRYKYYIIYFFIYFMRAELYFIHLISLTQFLAPCQHPIIMNV